MNFELMINSLPRFLDGVLTTMELMAISLSAGWCWRCRSP